MLLWLSPLLGFSQSSQLDSLLGEASRNAARDTVQLTLLNEIAYAYHPINPDSGVLYAEKALDLARDLAHDRFLGVAYSHLGTNYWAKGKDSLALKAYQKSLEIHGAAKNPVGMARALSNLALVHYNLSDFPTAIAKHDEAIQLFRDLNHLPGQYYNYSNMGVVYLALADYTKALETFLEAARLAAEDDSVVKGNLATNIGLVYKNIGQLDDALNSHLEALAVYTALDNRQGMANAMGNLGAIYDMKEQHDQAMAYFVQALEINEAIGNDRRVASDYTNMGEVFRKQGLYAKAFDHFEKARILYEGSHDLQNRSRNYLQIAALLEEMSPGELAALGISPAEVPQIVLEWRLKSKDTAIESGALGVLEDVYRDLSLSFERLGDYAKALYWYKSHVEISDSIMNDTKRKELMRQQVQFGFEKKAALLQAEHEKELEVGKAETRRQQWQKNIFLVGFISVLFFSWVAYALYKKKRDAKEREKEASLKQHMAETEMKWLKAQLDPHFIFNSLNSISDFILRNDSMTADYYLGKFAKLMRMILEKSGEKAIRLSEDLQMLELYMQLESLRLNNKFTYNIKVEEGLDPDQIEVPPLLLQPYVENSIWHGLSGMEGPGKILILVYKTINGISCSVEDNGVGRKAGIKQTKHPGWQSRGMSLTADRLAMWNITQSREASVSHIDLEHGFKVELNLSN
ncbi:tetratricopeptide repeat protein [Negadavirga shengliensis]|uniref:Tetratricopeptide repeat protein n=1 Tax=Negadavirga shengliensis TaxID=1389218 RepID=A0ABV9T2P3_9BACT